MSNSQLIWQTSSDGVLSVEVNGHKLTVERMLPAAEFRFVVWSADQPPVALRSGHYPSAEEAMRAAEQASGRIPVASGRTISSAG